MDKFIYIAINIAISQLKQKYQNISETFDTESSVLNFFHYYMHVDFKKIKKNCNIVDEVF